MLCQKLLQCCFCLIFIICTVYRFQLVKDLFMVLLTDMTGNSTAQMNLALLMLRLRKLPFYCITHSNESIGCEQENLLHTTLSN